jgi:hypothetical protein
MRSKLVNFLKVCQRSVRIAHIEARVKKAPWWEKLLQWIIPGVLLKRLLHNHVVEDPFGNERRRPADKSCDVG